MKRDSDTKKTVEKVKRRMSSFMECMVATEMTLVATKMWLAI
jgi:hypothetical protein